MRGAFWVQYTTFFELKDSRHEIVWQIHVRDFIQFRIIEKLVSENPTRTTIQLDIIVRDDWEDEILTTNVEYHELAPESGTRKTSTESKYDCRFSFIADIVSWTRLQIYIYIYIYMTLNWQKDSSERRHVSRNPSINWNILLFSSWKADTVWNCSRHRRSKSLGEQNKRI